MFLKSTRLVPGRLSACRPTAAWQKGSGTAAVLINQRCRRQGDSSLCVVTFPLPQPFQAPPALTCKVCWPAQQQRDEWAGSPPKKQKQNKKFVTWILYRKYTSGCLGRQGEKWNRMHASVWRWQPTRPVAVGTEESRRVWGWPVRAGGSTGSLHWATEVVAGRIPPWSSSHVVGLLGISLPCAGGVLAEGANPLCLRWLFLAEFI